MLTIFIIILDEKEKYVPLSIEGPMAAHGNVLSGLPFLGKALFAAGYRSVVAEHQILCRVGLSLFVLRITRIAGFPNEATGRLKSSKHGLTKDSSPANAGQLSPNQRS
jgi:hypothetical protein